MSNICWPLVVSENTDRMLRSHLVRNGGKKGDLSRFVDETVLALKKVGKARIITAHRFLTILQKRPAVFPRLSEMITPNQQKQRLIGPKSQ